jgi:hypothetical protein
MATLEYLGRGGRTLPQSLMQGMLQIGKNSFFGFRNLIVIAACPCRKSASSAPPEFSNSEAPSADLEAGNHGAATTYFAIPCAD